MKAAPLDDERWMRQALALARRGRALAHPNPMVGALLVRNGRVVGQGFHTYDGLLHAEVIAIQQAERRARGSTLYVNLEPCSHSGRTGPCTEAILEAGVRRVVAAMLDPNPLVTGKGFRRLRRRGVQVDVGPGEAQARRLNEAFASWVRRGRPLVTLKTAATLDGQLSLTGNGRARNPAAGRWVSSDASRRHVQQQRHAADAILTGIGTVRADDPLLTDRTGRRRRRPLLRVVLDSRLRLPLDSQLVRSARGDVLVFTLLPPTSPRARRLNRRGVGVARVRARGGRIDLAAVLAELGRRGILDVLVEAGPRLNGALLSAGLVDKLFLFYAPKILGRPTVPLALAPHAAAKPLVTLAAVEMHRFGPDFALEGYLRNVYRDH
jgi:diaminohydroxyphosphoribosylaminopyrimidine deaminase/5-amino-6-(5-phosphoribosylamino)uracil reductase